MNLANQNLLKSKQHFSILDGLRGIAAIIIVIFHFIEFVNYKYSEIVIGHSFLAVDFFFCLSGFVIAYAYDSRIEKIGLLSFFKLRLIRLQPLVIISSILGLLAFLFNPYVDLYPNYGASKTFLIFLASCLMIPYPFIPERYNTILPLNPPAWSLFWEYIANICYALFLVKLKNKLIWILTIIGTIGICYVAYTHKDLSGGWGKNNISVGGIRVFFSFLAGVLVYRLNWIIKSKLGFISLSILLLLTFFAPYSKDTNWIVEPLIIVIYFPLLITLGAGAQLKSRFKKICKFSGKISYPLYILHYPFIWIFGSYVSKMKPSTEDLVKIIPVCTILLIAFSYVIMKSIDIPIRSYLKKKITHTL